MAIALRSETDGATGTRTNTTITAPAGITNGDILILVLVTGQTTAAPTPTPPSGFTRIGTELSYVEAGYGVKLGMWWKRAASESGNYTSTHASAESQGWIGCFSGCLASGTPVGTPSQNGADSQTTTYTGVTTTAANSWIIGAAADWTWAGGLTVPTGGTERIDGWVYVFDQLIASAGATGNRTQTNSNASASEPFLAYLVELLPAASATSRPFRRNTIVPWRRSAGGVYF